MFSNLKQLFSSSNKDLRKRIYFTLFCLAIFSFGSTIPVQWANIYVEELGFLEIFNLMSGGGLGITPYITAQIITQLLQMDIIPYFKELKEQGYTGKQKINKITRYLGVLFAFVQGFIFTIVYSGIKDPMVIVKTTLYSLPSKTPLTLSNTSLSPNLQEVIENKQFLHLVSILKVFQERMTSYRSLIIVLNIAFYS